VELGFCELPIPLWDGSEPVDGPPLPLDIVLLPDVAEEAEFPKPPPPNPLFEFPPNALFDPPPKLDPPPNALFEFPPKLDGCEKAELDPPNAEALPA
jgi:hypothetical protein